MRTAVAVAMAIVMFASTAFARKWTDSTGRYTVEADFLDFKDGKVRMSKEDGTTVTVPIERLSEADQEWVKRQVKEKDVAGSEQSERPVARGPQKSQAETPRFKSLVEVRGNFTTAILRSHAEKGKKGVMVYPGSTLWLEMAEQGKDKPIAAKALLDEPQSLWFVAEGGVTADGWKRSTERLQSATGMFALGTSTLSESTFLPGTDNSTRRPALLEGRMYLIDAKNEPQPTQEGAYSVWISFAKDQSVREKNDPSSAVLRTVSAGEKLELLLAGKEPSGWRKVRTDGATTIEGWLRGEGRVTACFMKNEALASEAPQGDRRPKLRDWVFGKWQSVDDESHTVCFSSTNGRKMKTEDGLEIEYQGNEFQPDGGVSIKTKRGLKPGFFRFVAADTIEFVGVLGNKESLRLAGSGDKLNITDPSGQTTSFRRVPEKIK